MMSDETNLYYFLFNLLTLEEIMLPPDIVSGWRILSSPPTDSTCIIVSLDARTSFFSFCHLGDTEWNFVTGPDVESNDRLYRVTVCDGRIYFMGLDSSLFILEFFGDAGKSFRIKKLFGKLESAPSISELLPDAHYYEVYLIELYGEMYVITFNCLGKTISKVRDIEVFELDLLKSKWIKVESVDDFAFFIDRRRLNSYMSCCASNVGWKKNSIYYIEARSRALRRYDLEDDFIYCSCPCPNLKPEWEDVEGNDPIWI